MMRCTSAASAVGNSGSCSMRRQVEDNNLDVVVAQAFGDHRQSAGLDHIRMNQDSSPPHDGLLRSAMLARARLDHGAHSMSQ